MNLKPLALALALGIIGTGGVACARTSSAGAGGTAAPAQVTTVKVVNEGFADMEIYVVNSPVGPETRIGTALANSTTNMTLPAQVLMAKSTPVSFRADPVGRARPSVSSSIVVTRGDVVTLRIPPG